MDLGPIFLSGKVVMENGTPLPDLGTITLLRYAKVEGAVSASAPKQAQKAFEMWRDAMRKEKWRDAGMQFEKAAGIHPQYSNAWFELGLSLQRLNDVLDARTAYRKALVADPKFVSPYLQLAEIAAQEANWQALLDTTDRAVKLAASNYPGLYFYNAVAEFNLQNAEAAERSAREALKLDTQNRYPAANDILGIILARKGDLVAAADYLKAFIKLAPADPNIATAKQQLADVERMAKAAPAVTQ